MNALMISGEALLHELSLIEGLVPSRMTGVFDASTEPAMVLAQIELLKSGYYLADSTMDEGHFYSQLFMRSDGEWPYHVTLRFMTDGVAIPVLALMYRENGELRQYDRAGRMTHGTGTSNAERMRFAFEQEHPDTVWFWMPVFIGTPLARR